MSIQVSHESKVFLYSTIDEVGQEEVSSGLSMRLNHRRIYTINTTTFNMLGVAWSDKTRQPS